MKSVRALIVDDSASMRALIRATLAADKRVSVVGEAANPLEAREAIKALNPDVMTLDVEMPHMNGLEFLERVMRLRPLPVIMVSSHTDRGAAATIAAMETGAIDCVSKPSLQWPNTFAHLADKVVAAAGARLNARSPTPTPTAPERRAATPAANGKSPALAHPSRLIAIGASTGGVEALVTILAQFPRDCAPTLVTIHLPAMFTKSFAQRLDRICAPQVHEAVNGEPLLPGVIYVAPGTHTHLEVSGGGEWRCVLREGDLQAGHRPSVDALFNSVARHVGAKAIGVILTGMGADGAQGLLAMRKAGARTLGQNEATCVVYGMPKVADQIGAVEKQAPLQSIAAELAALTARN
jgi:two-component system chemotaxis response regulator CheB